MIRRYYCLSCKKTFELEVERKKIRMECPTCHDETYVRYATPKQVVPLEKRLSWERRAASLLNKVRLDRVSIEMQKFKLVYEHNLIAALKKHVPDKAAFLDALKLAKEQTRRQRKESLKNLEMWGCVKRESELGWEFNAPRMSKFYRNKAELKKGKGKEVST